MVLLFLLFSLRIRSESNTYRVGKNLGNYAIDSHLTVGDTVTERLHLTSVA